MTKTTTLPVVADKSTAMTIELKNVKINLSGSEETIMFTADIYLNGKKVGYAKNEGCGGMTNYRAINPDYVSVIDKMEEWCKGLPPHTYPADEDSEALTVDMNLEMIIDLLIDKEVQKKEVAAFEKMLKKKMVNHIVAGVPGADSARQWKFNRPLAEIASDKLYAEIDKIKAQLKPGEVILNTNLPPRTATLTLTAAPRPLTQQQIKEKSQLIVLGYAFAEQLLADIGMDNLKEVVRRNATPEYVRCCASHDFCDANMSMDAALKKHGIDGLKNTDLWNKVWEYAKGKGFFVEQMEHSTKYAKPAKKKSGDEWCECGKSETAGVSYFGDGQHPVIKKHHYRCNNCKGIVQIG